MTFLSSSKYGFPKPQRKAVAKSNQAKKIALPTNNRPYSCCGHYIPSFLDGVGDYGFEVTSTNFKFGPGVIKEIGFDAKVLGIDKKRIALFTDPVVRKIEVTEQAVKALKDVGCTVDIFDEVRIEPTDKSFLHAAKYASEGKFDGIVSIGGGSVMDTAKAANLYSTYPPKEFLDYVNPPIGKGMPVPGPLKPHIAVPSTSGTGSEATGFSIFKLTEMHAKTGIAHKNLRPDRAVIDSNITSSLPSQVIAASGFDVLSHALESYTARPYTKRIAGFKFGTQRPQNQGANPYSDFGCLEALRIMQLYFIRAVNDPNDFEAREQMLFASTLAGSAMGSAGVHVPHGCVS